MSHLEKKGEKKKIEQKREKKKKKKKPYKVEIFFFPFFPEKSYLDPNWFVTEENSESHERKHIYSPVLLRS